MKRIISALLACSILLTTSSLAATDINAGTGNATYGNEAVTANNSGWSTRTDSKYGPGLLIHVETTGDVTLRYDEKDKISDESMNEFGTYWATHFPNTDPNKKQMGVYLLPTYAQSDKKNAENGKPFSALVY